MQSLVDKGPARPCPADFNLAGYVLAAAKEFPEKVALAVVARDGVVEETTFAALASRVCGLAAGFADLGLRPGDRVMLRLGNTSAFPVTFLAAIAAGLIPVPTAAQLTAPEATILADLLQPALIVAGDGIALPTRSHLRILEEAALARLVRDRGITPIPGDPDRPAFIVFTSGTSGQPRAVVHAHRAIWARRLMHRGWYGLRRSDRLLHAGAFNWTFTLGTGLLDPWSVGATALIPAPGVTATDLPDVMAAHEATLFAAAPGVFRQMLRSARQAPPHLRHGLSAGEKMPEALHDTMAATFGVAVHEAFGQSECSTFISGSPTRPAPRGTIGYPQPGRRIAIIGPDGAPVPQDTPGVIAVDASDPGLMLGYLDAQDATRSRFTADGAWYCTGDTGMMTADGAIAYLGRDDDMMNAGGFRVSPVEVETALAAHPGVSDVAAVETEVRPGVTVVTAFYTGPESLPETDLHAFAAARLARYKAPRRFIRLDALPRGANGKLLRRRLREHDGGPDDTP